MLKIKRYFSIALIIAGLFFNFGIEKVNGENKNSSSGIDVVFLIDSSKSMTKSDPEGLTYEAMKMFIDMCHTKGDKGGMVSYSGNIVREYKVQVLNSDKDKSSLKNTLINLELGNWTDIGLGLKKAVNILKEGNRGGNKPIIILLSDGKNDPERNKSESEDDIRQALSQAKLNKYPIYTIGLNADGTVDKNQLENISKTTGGRNFITNTAEEIPSILRQIFADNFSLKVLQQNFLIGNNDFQEVRLNIPDDNETEANISILSSNPVEIKLTNPKGEIVQIPSDKFLYSKSSKYSLLKLISPGKGSWTLHVKGSSLDKINISLISNYDLLAVMKLNPDKDMYKGDKTTIISYLESNGKKLEDEAIYGSSKASLVVNNLDKSEVKEFPMEYKNNEFTGEYTLNDDDRYEIKVRIESAGFIRESEIKALGTKNRIPAMSINIGNITLWSQKDKEIVLSQFFTDEDKDKLNYSVLNSSTDVISAELKGEILSLKGKKIGESSITIICDDSKGGTLTKEIKVRVFYISCLIYIILFLILIGAIIYIIRKAKNKNNDYVPGQMVIEIKEGSSRKKPYSKSLSSFKRSFTMQELLDLNPDYKETEKIIIKVRKNGPLIIINNSECEVTSYGKKIGTRKHLIMKNNYKITVYLSDINTSINIQYLT